MLRGTEGTCELCHGLQAHTQKTKKNHELHPYNNTPESSMVVESDTFRSDVRLLFPPFVMFDTEIAW